MSEDQEAGSGPVRAGRWSALLAAALVCGCFVIAHLSSVRWPSFYHASVQEDQYIEWASFVFFLVAAVVFAAAARRQRRLTGQLPWFVFGGALFCFVVAMEEISWGQRLIGFAPPEYFLTENFQQEANVHNVFSKSSRKAALGAIMLGYGVVLPIAMLAAPLRSALRRLAIVESPSGLAASFLAMFVVYVWYPWPFTGEWVELTLGAGFLFAAFAQLRHFSRNDAPLASRFAVSWIAVLLSGWALAEVSDAQTSRRPETYATVEAEVCALATDFAQIPNPCYGRLSVHKRLHTYVDKYGADQLREGVYASLVAQRLPEKRARFFLDPWNSPYWVRCRKHDTGVHTIVYSFGANRRRESDNFVIAGDDFGVRVARPKRAYEEIKPDAAE